MTDVADILRQVRKIELRTKRVVSALTAGGYRSVFKGTGLEFDEVREYIAGDDVRSIDWNVTARAGRAHVKVFREERELTLMLLVDTSGSMRFGAIPGVSPRAKLALAAEAAAVVAVTALRNRDRIGLVRFAEASDVRLQPRRGRGHALRVVREVLAAPTTARGTALHAALEELVLIAKRRCVCFLISDFLFASRGDEARFADALARAGRRHDVVGLRVADPGESALPRLHAPLVLRDPESGREAVFAGGPAAAAAYAAAWTQTRERCRGWFRASGCDLVELSTDASAVSAMQRFFRERRRRLR